MKIDRMLYEDVKKLLKPLEGMAVCDVRLLLEKALYVIECNSYLDLTNFKEIKLGGDEKNGE